MASMIPLHIRSGRRLLCFTASALFFVSNAAGSVATCVEVSAPPEQRAPLERLVRHELGRHPSHRVVDQGCETHLTVEVIELPDGRYLTGRTDGQVPHRERVETDTARAVSKLLSVVLHNDPVVLRGPERAGWFAEALGRLRRDGYTLYGAELFQWLPVVENGERGLPGVAARLRREVGGWYVGARIGGAFAPTPYESRLRPSAYVGAHAEVGSFLSAQADASPYGALLLGLEHQRFRGPAPLLGPSAEGSALSTGLSFGLRLGVELLRTTSMRFDAFTQANVPAFITSDPDGGVLDAWIPSVTVGAGVAF